VAEETVEDVRNVEDGARRAWKPVVKTPKADVAKRDRNPMEGAPRREARGGRETVELWRGVKAYERMSPFTQVSG
jgi:hypothetical protein